MIELNRYAISGEHFEVYRDSGGDFVQYEDYEALQQQLTATTNSLTNAQEALKSAGIEADTVQAGVMELKARRDALAAENAILKSGIGFFSYGSDSGFEEHESAEKAIEAADCDIDYYRGDACEGWPEETDQTVWGVIMQRATMVNEQPRTEELPYGSCDYALLPNLATPATDAYLNAVRELEQRAEAAEADNRNYSELLSYHIDRQAKAEAKLAELEKFTSEEKPFMYGIMTANGDAHFDDFCVSPDPGLLEDEIWEWNNGLADNEPKNRVVALYTHPAPAIDLNAVRAEGLDMAAAEVDRWIGCDLLAREIRLKSAQLRAGNAGKDGV